MAWLLGAVARLLGGELSAASSCLCLFLSRSSVCALICLCLWVCSVWPFLFFFFFFKQKTAYEIHCVTGVQTCALPIFCEKPMAMDSQECRRMIEACRRRGVKLGIAYYRRFFPIVLKIKELLEHGSIGEPILVRRSEERRVGKECRSRWATHV